MGRLGLAVGLRAVVARPPGPIPDLQSHLAPIRGHALALALDHDPIPARSPGRVQWVNPWQLEGRTNPSPQGWMLLG